GDSLQGGQKAGGAGQRGWPGDAAFAAGARRAPRPVEVRDAAGAEHVGVDRFGVRARRLGVGRRTAVREDEPPDPKIREPVDGVRERGGGGRPAAPGEGGDPVWPGGEPAREPVTRHLDTLAHEGRLVAGAHRGDYARGPGREG